MWIHLPSECFPSALELADSTLGYGWLYRQLARSVTLRGKSIAWPRWQRAWLTAGWIRRQCGQTLEPSTAAPGVAQWIASWAATPANPFPTLASAEGTPTSATCGPISPASSVNASPDGASSRTWRATYRLDLSRSSQTFRQWATALRRACLQRRKLARRTNANGCSSWLTPHGMNSVDATGKRGAGGEFAQQATHWQTPHTMAGGGWHRGAGRQEEMLLPGQAEQVAESAKTTPRVGGLMGHSSKDVQEGGNSKLEAVVAIWATPNAQLGTGYMSGSNRDTWRPTLESQAQGKKAVLHRGRLAQNSKKRGGKSSSTTRNSRLRLNPLFVEWLMGLPIGWTDLKPVATESFQLWLDWHSWSYTRP